MLEWLGSFVLTRYREIEDGEYLHTFRVLNDEDSGGVRFEVTPRRGTMTKTPIWTAFVNEHLDSRSWVRRIRSKVIQFSDLRPYIFCNGYIPTHSRERLYELHFTSKQGKSSYSNKPHVMLTNSQTQTASLKCCKGFGLVDALTETWQVPR